MRIIASFLIFVFAAQSSPIPAGTRVEAKLESDVKTESSRPGDPVIAVLTEPIRVSKQVVVPRGSRLNGRVETVESASLTSEGRVRLAFREIQFPDGRRATTWITESYAAKPHNQTLRYALLMATGGVGGAFAGGTAARVAGILGGVLIGFVLAGNTGDHQPNVTLSPGKILHLQLGEDLAI